MSLDRSLKSGSGLTKHRNVLTRPERIAKLAEREKFDPEKNNPLGLPKVANRKVVTGSKAKKAAEEGEGVEGATPAAGAAATAATPAGKAAAPAGKAAAPAGKGATPAGKGAAPAGKGGGKGKG